MLTPLRFVVTVDTEADDAWAQPETISMDNMRELPRFQELCVRYGVIPTYLLTYECATRDDALSVLKKIAGEGNCEIGHHLHVWTTPPFQRAGPSGVDLDWIHAFQFQLPDSLFREKAERLRAAIESEFGSSPTAHRAGRWGIDQRTVDWMASAGFVVETSIRSGIRLGDDFPAGEPKELDRVPYFRSRNPYIWPGGDSMADRIPIIEVPATVDFPDQPLAALSRCYLAAGLPGKHVMTRVYRRLGGQRMLRPNPSYGLEDLPNMIDRAIAQKVTVINLMLHSSELGFGCSPFSRTANDAERVWTHLEVAFQAIQSRGIPSCGISDIGRLALNPGHSA